MTSGSYTLSRIRARNCVPKKIGGWIAFSWIVGAIRMDSSTLTIGPFFRSIGDPTSVCDALPAKSADRTAFLICVGMEDAHTIRTWARRNEASFARSRVVENGMLLFGVAFALIAVPVVVIACGSEDETKLRRTRRGCPESEGRRPAATSSCNRATTELPTPLHACDDAGLFDIRTCNVRR